jgi:hypothetical protein
MISARVAAEEARRFSCLPFWRQLEPAGRDEIIVALARYADDDAHAARIVDAWLRESRELPTPADIRAAARGTHQSERRNLHDKCRICGGTGWEHYLLIPAHTNSLGQYVEKREVRAGDDGEIGLMRMRKTVEAYDYVRRCTAGS